MDWRGRILLSLALCLVPHAGAAQTQPPDWLRGIDELMQVEVTSAARRERRLADTAAAAFVLTRDDIRRSGLTNVPSLLRLVPGVQVAQIDGNKWAVSVRGFNSRWANKLLVMIDGQSVYSDAFSGVYWNALDVSIDRIERIEVVRGPGGSLWGANAVNGVINIITRAAAAEGGTATGVLGTTGLSTASMRYAGGIGTRARYFISGGAGDQDAMHPELAVDDWRSLRAATGFTWDISSRDAVDVQTTVHRSDTSSTALQVTSESPFVREQVLAAAVTNVHRTSATWTRTLRDGGTLQTSGTWSLSHRDDSFLRLDSDVLELSFQHAAHRKGRHELTWGAAVRRSDNTMNGSLSYDLLPHVINQSQAGAFAQDDIRVAGNRIVVTLGSKLERFTHTGWHWQPTARMLWNATATQSVWGAASRAVRTPSLTERGMVVPLFEWPGRIPIVAKLFGNPNVREESLAAYEAGYRWIASAVSVDVAAYYNRYDDFVNLEAGTPYPATGSDLPHMILPVGFDNRLNVATGGGEALLTVSASPRWRIVGSYALFTVRSRLDPNSRNFADAAFDAASPRHQGTVRSLFALPRGVDLDATVYLVGALEADGVPSHTRIDTRIGWRVLPALDLSLAATNVLDSRHVEFNDDSAGVAFSRARRQLAVTATWRF